MTDHPAPSQPARTGDCPALPNHRCPLCGGPNGCAPAASGVLNTPCWCRQATFTPELLARVPEAQRNLSCICARCAGFAPETEKHQASSS